MKKFHLYCIILGAGFLVFLILKIGASLLWQELVTLGWGLVPMIMMNGLGKYFHALGWRYCLIGPYRTLPLSQVVSIRMAGFAINQLTPTATVGGYVTMGTLLSMGRQELNAHEAATSAIIGKLSHTLAQLLFVVLGSIVIIYTMDLPAAVWTAMVTGSIILGVGVFAFLIVQKYGKLGAVIRWLVAHKYEGKAITRLSYHITEIDSHMKLFYEKYPMDMTISVFWNIIALACGIGQTWFFFSFLTGNDSLLMASGVWFLASWFEVLSFAIPSSIGVLEGTSVLNLKIAGLSAALGLTYGIALRAGQLFWSAVGLLLYAQMIHNNRKRDG